MSFSPWLHLDRGLWGSSTTRPTDFILLSLCCRTANCEQKRNVLDTVSCYHFYQSISQSISDRRDEEEAIFACALGLNSFRWSAWGWSKKVLVKAACPSVEFGRSYGVRKRVASSHGGRRRITLYILRKECRGMSNSRNPFSYIDLRASSTMLFLHW